MNPTLCFQPSSSSCLEGGGVSACRYYSRVQILAGLHGTRNEKPKKGWCPGRSRLNNTVKCCTWFLFFKCLNLIFCHYLSSTSQNDQGMACPEATKQLSRIIFTFQLYSMWLCQGDMRSSPYPIVAFQTMPRSILHF